MGRGHSHGDGDRRRRHEALLPPDHGPVVEKAFPDVTDAVGIGHRRTWIESENLCEMVARPRWSRYRAVQPRPGQEQMGGMTHLPVSPPFAGRRRSLPSKAGKGAEGIFLLGAEPGGDLHLGDDQKVPAPSAAEVGSS